MTLETEKKTTHKNVEKVAFVWQRGGGGVEGGGGREASKQQQQSKKLLENNLVSRSLKNWRKQKWKPASREKQHKKNRRKVTLTENKNGNQPAEKNNTRKTEERLH